jgi:hypothetical protein
MTMPEVGAERRRTSRTKDFYSTSVPWILLTITVLPFLVLFAWLAVAYAGIEYGTPPWNTHSVPPPLLY